MVRECPDVFRFAVGGREWCIDRPEVGRLSLPLRREFYARNEKPPLLGGIAEATCVQTTATFTFLVCLYPTAFEKGFLRDRNAVALENVCRRAVFGYIREHHRDQLARPPRLSGAIYQDLIRVYLKFPHHVPERR